MGRSNVISRIFAGPLDPIKQPVGRLTSPQSRLGQAEGQLDTMTTVLAQDHFYSDFLSLHVSVKTNNNAMMMLLLPCAGKDASGLAPAGLRTSHRAARLPTEWLKSIAYCLGASNACPCFKS